MKWDTLRTSKDGLLLLSVALLASKQPFHLLDVSALVS